MSKQHFNLTPEDAKQVLVSLINVVPNLLNQTYEELADEEEIIIKTNKNQPKGEVKKKRNKKTYINR